MNMKPVTRAEFTDPRERFDGWIYYAGPFDEEIEIWAEAMINPSGTIDEADYWIDDYQISCRTHKALTDELDRLTIEAWKKRKAQEREEACK